MEKLDLRLAAAAEFVKEGTVAADVGTDHGYLICYLINEGICTRGFATDINIKPLESARKLIREMDLENEIETVLTDGLKGLPEDEIDEVLICGMGGETIIGILEEAKWVKSEKVHLVLQPMSRADMLRRWLCENGWSIDAEKAVEVEKHLYTVISAEYIGGSEVPDDLYCLTGELLSQNDEFALKYVRWQANIQRGIASGLLRSEKEKEHALVHIQLADMLDEQADETENDL
ncbi:MAG: SAM-dependent methyltransferase [Oscillospiraceae bacterium]|nr:SAM-dependent methyltransferase [Oscillospiraceae bacterium]MBP1574282.1 SAM-dependent methyltransferase [Oscillospiraceae bacterium]MBQ8596073.1 SAM-dependent methyltransferase [Oscillospiraceae bacterium]